jgi:hypothetical protein
MDVFNVTYGIITPDSAEYGEYDEQGFVDEGVDLRTAIDAIGGQALAHSGDFKCFTNDEYGHGTTDYFMEGSEETRSLHLPENTTPSSARRIARLLGI